jgi:hypothetical protein
MSFLQEGWGSYKKPVVCRFGCSSSRRGGIDSTFIRLVKGYECSRIRWWFHRAAQIDDLSRLYLKGENIDDFRSSLFTREASNQMSEECGSRSGCRFLLTGWFAIAGRQHAFSTFSIFFAYTDAFGDQS